MIGRGGDSAAVSLGSSPLRSAKTRHAGPSGRIMHLLRIAGGSDGASPCCACDRRNFSARLLSRQEIPRVSGASRAQNCRRGRSVESAGSARAVFVFPLRHRETRRLRGNDGRRCCDRFDAARKPAGWHGPTPRPLVRDNCAEAHSEARRREHDVVLPDGTTHAGRTPAHWRRVALPGRLCLG